MSTEQSFTPTQVMGVQLGLHRQLRAEHLLGQRCPECDCWVFASLDDHPDPPLMVCGYCGEDWTADFGRGSLA
jgi:hypothetical protein